MAKAGLRAGIAWFRKPVEFEPRSSLLMKALVWDGLFLFLGAIATDYGILCAIALAAVLAHWAGIAMVLLRRARTCRRTDVFFIRYGILILLPLSGLFAGMWMHLAWEMRWWWLVGLK